MPRVFETWSEIVERVPKLTILLDIGPLAGFADFSSDGGKG